jgi:hypothetical protein
MMHGAQHLNPLLAVHVAAAEDRHRVMREAARQEHMINGRALALGKTVAGRPSPVRREIGVTLIRVGARLMGRPAISING